MRSVNPQNQMEEGQNPFGLSIGDLMAGLLLIFILLLTSTLLRLQEEFQKTKDLSNEYSDIKNAIYEALISEFRGDTIRWNAVIEKDLSIRFRITEPRVLFRKNESEIQPDFKVILNEFFPRYINVLYSPDFKTRIEEIRIEGHTDSDGGYYYNMKLSQDRTRSVLEYVMEETELEDGYKSWLFATLTANGLSYSRRIADNNSVAGKSLNRRVEFKIRTNAEEQLKKLELKFTQ